MAQIILFNPSNGLIMDNIDSWPPWALLYASTKLSKEYSIKIIDSRFDRNWRKILDNELNNETLCVGVTALTGLQLQFAIEFLEEVKKRKPKVKKIMGGIHATSTPVDTLKEKLVDFVVIGDGETTFYNLVSAIEKDKGFDKVKGIAFKDIEGNIKVNEIEDFENLETLDEIPLNLVDVNRYVTLEEGRRKFIIFTSRGCPFGCSYCHNSSVHNKGRWRSISAEKIISFMKKIMNDYKVSYFVIQDDNFWVDKKRVELFVDLLEKEKMDIRWAVHGATIVSLKYITPEIARRLKKNGLEKILCGIESVSPKIQKVIGKYIDVNDVYKVDSIMYSAGIKMIYSFMCGFPGETDEDIKMNINTMLKIKKQSPHNDVGNIKPVIYYPGTKLFDWAVENGFMPPKRMKDWCDYTWSNYDVLEYPWITKKRKKFFQSLYFATLILNPEYEYIKNPIWKYMCIILYPITKWRVKHLYFKFSPLIFLLNIFKKMNLI